MKALNERVACAVEVVNRIVADEKDAVVRSLTADKGYFAIEEIAPIQAFDIRALISDANASSCRLCRQEPGWQSALAQARHAPGTRL
jgi:hypothetical protein